jgi:hypothetical protein
VVCALLGALLGISTAEYNRGGHVDDEEDIWPDEVDDEDE